MATLSGIVTTPTYWDFARCARDLPLLFQDSLKCDYDPSQVRLVSSVLAEPCLSKDVDIEYAVDYDLIPPGVIPPVPVTTIPKSYVTPQLVAPTVALELLTRLISAVATVKTGLSLYHIAQLLQYKYQYPDLDRKTAVLLYQIFRSDKLGVQVLRQLVGPIPGGIPPYIKNLSHPFIGVKK